MSDFSKKWEALEQWLLEPINKPLPLYMCWLRSVLRIVYAIVKDLMSGQVTLHAMSLVYTTILSLVPLLALSFSVLKAFNVQDRFTPMLYSFLEPMGEKGIEIHNNILSFVDNMKVGVLGVIGFLLLFYTVISLIQKIETAFNTIWYAPELRSLGQRVSNYLIVVLVGPVLVVSALSITASTLNSSMVQALIAIEPFGSMIYALTKLMPFFMIILAFTLFYVLMPNTKVLFKSALVGGVVGGTAWQASSVLFTTIMVNSAKYDAVYSGFAVGILLLIWLYINWLILLLGSSVAFYHQHSNHITRDSDLDVSSEVFERVGLDLMVHVARVFEEEDLPVKLTNAEGMHTVPGVVSRKVIDKLIAKGLLVVAGEQSDQLVPGRSTDKISVAQILNALRERPSGSYPTRVSPAVDQLLLSERSALDERLGHILLRDLINEKHSFG